MLSCGFYFETSSARSYRARIAQVLGGWLDHVFRSGGRLDCVMYLLHEARDPLRIRHLHHPCDTKAWPDFKVLSWALARFPAEHDLTCGKQQCFPVGIIFEPSFMHILTLLVSGQDTCCRQTQSEMQTYPGVLRVRRNMKGSSRVAETSRNKPAEVSLAGSPSSSLQC